MPREEAGDVMRENPLAGGLAGLAVGALLGASIPETEKENEVLGPYRDELADRAREKTYAATDRARRVASTAAQAVTEAVKQEARSSSQGAGSQQTPGRSDFPNIPPNSSSAISTTAEPWSVARFRAALRFVGYRLSVISHQF